MDVVTIRSCPRRMVHIVPESDSATKCTDLTSCLGLNHGVAWKRELSENHEESSQMSLTWPGEVAGSDQASKHTVWRPTVSRPGSLEQKALSFVI